MNIIALFANKTYSYNNEYLYIIYNIIKLFILYLSKLIKIKIIFNKNNFNSLIIIIVLANLYYLFNFMFSRVWRIPITDFST